MQSCTLLLGRSLSPLCRAKRLRAPISQLEIDLKSSDSDPSESEFGRLEECRKPTCIATRYVSTPMIHATGGKDKAKRAEKQQMGPCSPHNLP